MSDIGIVGLGQMGGALARRALDKGYSVSGSELEGVPEDLKEAGVTPAKDLADLAGQLSSPRIFLLSVPAGPVVDNLIDELLPHIAAGDIVMDSGNSYWGDSRRRAERLRKDSVFFLDLGVSGGPAGARDAPCFMIGGPREAVEQVEPLLTHLAIAGGYVHAGNSGAGHFVKLVHNGIEFGMLQAIGEGVALLESYPEELEIAETLGCWRHGSVIRSWLVDLMAKAYAEDPAFTRPTREVEDTGEVNWLVGDALTLDTPIPVIAQSVMELLKSRDADGIAAKAITMMRHEFGGHPYGRDEAIARERRTGRVGPLYTFPNQRG